MGFGLGVDQANWAVATVFCVALFKSFVKLRNRHALSALKVAKRRRVPLAYRLDTRSVVFADNQRDRFAEHVLN